MNAEGSKIGNDSKSNRITRNVEHGGGKIATYLAMLFFPDGQGKRKGGRKDI